MNARRSANPFAAPDWADMFTPRCGKRRGRPFELGAGDPGDFLRQMTDAYNAIYAPMLENLMTYWGGSTASPWTAGAGTYWPSQLDPLTRRGYERRHWRKHDCGCEHRDCDGCHHDDCHCRCCITDADLVIHSRLGELRVVPLTIENPRRRERHVRLELSGWTTRSGSPANINAIIVPPTEFTLEPCSEREVVIAVQVEFREPGAAANGEPSNASAGLAGIVGRFTDAETPGRLPEVEHCEVYYADLRAEGCDIRPIRIAVVVLPRDCGAHPIDCGCGCC